ncbi:MAG: hypothetical protein OEZ13_05345 [Spirochaetia bacterium]|nr:hypothetical protein [Spirochaetia bacterium]
MNKVLATIDKYIDKIPEHIRDIVKKGYFAVLALGAVIAVLYGISAGEKGAKPSGMPLAKEAKDLFYLDQLREENLKRMNLVEDIEVDPLLFPSRAKETPYMTIGRDTMGHIMGEQDSLLKNPDNLRKKETPAGYLDEVPLFLERVPKESMLIEDDKKDNWMLKDEIDKAPTVKEEIKPEIVSPEVVTKEENKTVEKKSDKKNGIFPDNIKKSILDFIE